MSHNACEMTTGGETSDVRDTAFISNLVALLTNPALPSEIEQPVSFALRYLVDTAQSSRFTVGLEGWSRDGYRVSLAFAVARAFLESPPPSACGGQGCIKHEQQLYT